VKRALRIAGLALAGVLLLAAVFHTFVMAALAGYLEKDSAPVKADLAYVLAGDGYGHRIFKAGDLVREGYAPEALVGGPAGTYGFHESDLAIPFAVKAGYPESYFVGLPMDAHSTREEAQTAVAEFRRRGAKRVLLVTSNYHTRRSGGLFRSVAPDIDFVVVGAPDEHFTARGWWHDREAEKTFVIEWLKTVAGWFKI
jgi:uncharacterized SAM-binding protein YcdF (DUF218 family)